MFREFPSMFVEGFFYRFLEGLEYVPRIRERKVLIVDPLRIRIVGLRIVGHLNLTPVDW